VYRHAGQVGRALHAIRGCVEKLSERDGQSVELKELDEKLTELGFPKPNPMFVE
jgi:hypothetical protein